MINSDLKFLISFLHSKQRADGGFETYESYPVVKPEYGWTILPDASPFITSNILYCLLSNENTDAKKILEDGCKFLLRHCERAGYWRFWSLQSKQHPLPFDTDDTSIASYVLAKNGIELFNSRVLADNVDSRGYIYTWLLPGFKLFAQHPVASFGFAIDWWRVRATARLKYFAMNDAEPGVAANALLYLSEKTETTRCVNLIVEEILSDNYSMKFYEHKLVVYYHIARAFRKSVPSFEKLREKILKEIFCFINEESNANEMLKLMAANIILDFSGEKKNVQKILEDISLLMQKPEQLQPQAYFCSPDRNFLAGSPLYTIALYIEAVSKF